MAILQLGKKLIVAIFFAFSCNKFGLKQTSLETFRNISEGEFSVFLSQYKIVIKGGGRNNNGYCLQVDKISPTDQTMH